ncbi:S8 family serine peptidase [Nocardioides acrostichi]|uniref:S8 family serine peptidase n=1 Tax=Nocardioides acrostichi TaxID=2784339 RepID=A0A930YC07_9ACTN|nr:S8 family serine peptidase [Nocardioides acrostichi]MBF4163013.1 S8 family serine peptidase [Nocardioides acrostichi]
MLPEPPRIRRVLARALAALAVGAVVVTLAPAASSSAAGGDRGRLYLITFRGPGTAGSESDPPALLQSLRMRVHQDQVLDALEAPEPVYRWTTALDGVAVRLTRDQAAEAATVPSVARVEPDQLRPLASIGAQAATAAARRLLGTQGRDRGGAGVVVGVVDTGIDPDNPVFAPGGRLGRASHHFDGRCVTGPGWPASACSGKVVGARWFADGFGADNLSSSAALSARDDDGHGTQVASIIAGNTGVPVRVGDTGIGTFSGEAPQARLAVYKACWSAPDPDGDGCSTADLVTAIDRATDDGVDVLNLSVGGPSEIDTVDLALLGAVEHGVSVVTAAGSAVSGHDAGTAHPSPWVTTVGATTGVRRTGTVALGRNGPRLTGASAAGEAVGPLRMVDAARARAASATRDDARLCLPGSLDAAAVRDRIVVCDRGDIGRVDKSATVAAADGAGMVLVNRGPRSLEADFQSVPTVNVSTHSGAVLRRWVRKHPGGLARIAPRPVTDPDARVTGWSATGDPEAAVLKPDLVADGDGLLAAEPAGAASRWGLVSGTSMAAARVAGAAARLRALPGWNAARVQSALTTSAVPVAGSGVLAQGAGRLGTEPSRPVLVITQGAAGYRRWLEGRSVTLNLPSVTLLPGGTTHRTVTNAGRAARVVSVTGSDFTRAGVSVSPSSAVIEPGRSVRFTISSPTGPGQDSGILTFTTGLGEQLRVPVLIGR